ncbi:MAG: hypothetical protein WD099_10405 [Dongiaceae bacterium]
MQVERTSLRAIQNDSPMAADDVDGPIPIPRRRDQGRSHTIVERHIGNDKASAGTGRRQPPDQRRHGTGNVTVRDQRRSEGRVFVAPKPRRRRDPAEAGRGERRGRRKPTIAAPDRRNRDGSVEMRHRRHREIGMKERIVAHRTVGKRCPIRQQARHGRVVDDRETSAGREGIALRSRHAASNDRWPLAKVDHGHDTSSAGLG